MNQRYASKVDWWILISVAMAPIGLGIAAAAVPHPAMWMSCAAVLFMIGALCVPCDYTLADNELVIRSGLIKYRVPYSQIDRVEPTRNPLSSPAFSLDRLAIHYGGKSIMISPAAKEEFLTELRVRAKLSRVDASDIYARAV